MKSLQLKMQRRFFSATACRFNYEQSRPKKRLNFKEDEKLLNNVNRALTHYDDFYASVYGPQWPSLRLGLLSPPKYVALPNPFTGDVEPIVEKLQKLGAYSVQKMWMDENGRMMRERKEIDLKKDMGRLHEVDLAIESIAASKRAEEMDTLYQNAPTSSKKEEPFKLGTGNPESTRDSRIISSVQEASGSHLPATKIKGLEDFTFDSEYFSSYLKKHESTDDDFAEGVGSDSSNESEIQFLKAPLSESRFPQLLLPYTFENGSAYMFPPAGREKSSNLREYLCINGASIVPVLALDLKPGTNLLDLCAGPGTKSLLSLMTMCTDYITCNDLEQSRINRVERLFQEFTGTQKNNVLYTQYNAKEYPANEEYSRVLADVPCLNDRVSCTVSDNSIFKPRRTKERVALVETQRKILLSGFRALDRNLGSTVVYSTCTLSPIENDGVVMNALKETEIPDLYIDLIGLVKLITPFERLGIFKVMRTRCGVLILPNVVSNFGPMYISKIVVKPSTNPISTGENSGNQSPSTDELGATDTSKGGSSSSS